MTRGRKRFLCMALMICMLLGAASAENAYRSLCSRHGLERDEVIAWLEVENTSICLPVMMHPRDDAYYAGHDPYGNESETGSAYLQAGYNAADFSDPVSIIYGGSALETAPFAGLQELYSGSFEQCRTLYLHLPRESCEYRVFAALPHSSVHILHYYDFSSEKRYADFFDGVFSTRLLGMYLDENDRPEEGLDQVVILSTALRGDSLQRYLVMARKVTP